MSRRRRLFTILGPGLLVAATGVGAGDLATAGLAGTRLGTTIIWAVLLGAFLNYVINEGLARWQLATGETLLEGAVRRLGKGVAWCFVPYLLLWSFLVPTALMSACGVALHSMLPIFEDDRQGKIVLGVLQSGTAVVLVLVGGFKLFEKIMSVCIFAMFVTVLVTACLIATDLGDILRGILLPSIPEVRGALAGTGLDWTVALMGGVGGTLTVLCYGYWIREAGREGPGELRTCRIDLGIAYLMTAFFGVALIIIASRVSAEDKGLKLIINLARSLAEPLGPVGPWAFMVGAWCAVFSSLLGVWQAVPYLFANFYALVTRPGERIEVDTRGKPYRLYLFAIATVPVAGLWIPFETVQRITGNVGAFCMPLLAVALLLLNGRTDWVGTKLRNRWPTVVVLGLILVFFGWILVKKIISV